MTGICAIYSGFSQSRNSILSLTSTAIRANSRIHVRRNSVLTSASKSNTSIAPAFNLLRKIPTLSRIFSVNQFGGSSSTVSAKIWICNFIQMRFQICTN